MLNLDTHIFIYALIGNLSRHERDLLSADEWGISDIVIWEVSKLAQLGRIEVNINDSNLTRLLAGVQIWPISLDICRAIHSLDFRSDPADEIIAATSLVYKVPLLTRDAKIRRSKVVPLAMKSA